MAFLRRLLGLAGPRDGRDAIDGGEVRFVVASERRPVAAPERPTGLACPSCAALLDPPPVRNRLCPQCREPIVVRHVNGRVALLTRAAVTVFEAERRRSLDARGWTTARQGWIRLARRINASPARLARLETAPVSAETVRQSRAIYLAAAERAVRIARRERRWADVGRIRREQARSLHEEAGRPVPPPAPIEGLYREGMTAVLRSLEPLAREAELVSSGCCPACRAENGTTLRIAADVRLARLPHPGCPAGLCGCDWWPALADQADRSRRRRVRTSMSMPR